MTFRRTAKAVLHDFYMQQKADLDTEKIGVVETGVVETAAKLIRDEIRTMKTSYTAYRTCDAGI